MAEAVKRLWNLSKNELTREYLHVEEKRRRDREVKMQYKWEERIKKGMDKGKTHIEYAR